MKWFRHMATASEDEFIAALESEYGLEGYARWWKLLEAIARHMDGSDRHHAEYPIRKWMEILSIKREKFLKSFAEFLEKSGKINTNYSGNILKIGVPKLLELRDEYSRKSGHTPDTCPDNVAPETEQQTELDIITTTLPLQPRETSTAPPGDNSQEVDLNNFVNVVEVVCLLFGLPKLSRNDQETLAGWCERYDMRGYALPLIEKELHRFRQRNAGKNPNVLAYFNKALQANMPQIPIAAALAKQMRVN